MTAPIGGTAQQLPQDVPMHGPNKGGGPGKSHAKAAGEKSKAAGSALNPDLGDDLVSGSSSSQDTGTTRRASSEDHDRGKDDDASFEATIDTLDRDREASTSAADPTQTLNWAAQLAFGQMMVGQTAVDPSPQFGSQKVAEVGAAPGSTHLATSPKLLKEGSVTALLAAKDRILSGSKTPDNGLDEISDPVTTTPIVVQANEAHWDFRATPTTSGGGAIDPLNTHIAAQNPIAALANSGSAKQDAAAEKSAAASATTSSTQVSQIAAATDPRSGQFFDQRQGNGAGARESSPQSSDKNPISAAAASDALDTKPADGETSTGQALNAVQQIRNGITDALTNAAPDAQPPTASMLPQGRVGTPGQVLRNIDITLSPADLGSVRLRLSLKSNTLAIEAETSKASTAKMLNDDRDSLERNLRDAGYDVSTLKITDVAASNSTATSSMQAGSLPFQDGSQAKMSFADRRDGDLQRRDGGNPDQPQQRSKGDDRQGTSTTDLARPSQANAVYI